MSTSSHLSKRIVEALSARHQTQQWESFIVEMLEKLELSPDEHQRAAQHYQELGRHVAKKLGVGETDAHVFVQGSMRTQTTISPRGNQKFDLDVVVKLTGQRFDDVRDSDEFFQGFGEALKGVSQAAGDPKAKRRCWRLQYPGEPFYFDVTPALPNSCAITGTDLRVRDPDTIWSPSNPEEFATWFCEIAAKRFPFQGTTTVRMAEARTQVDPLPKTRVGIDDILRRAVQLMKLHRDNYYWELPQARKDAQPISVILVTLAGHAYDELVTNRQGMFSSPIEIVLELIDQLPNWIDRHNGLIRVDNPKLPSENFADRWNTDGGMRDREFMVWHQRLTADLEALFSEDYSRRSEQRIKNVFGQLGVDAWKASLPKPDVLQGLLATVPSRARTNPAAPTKVGSSSTLA